MHPAAYEWVKAHVPKEYRNIIDIGGRNINGTVRDLFPKAMRYVAVDLYAGDGVDVVSDVTKWETSETFDVVVCCEVLEHAPNWREIIAKALTLCKVGGTFIMTCAGPGRSEHSGIDGAGLQQGEHYGNIDVSDLRTVLVECGWAEWVVDHQGNDTRCVCVRW